MQNIGEELVGAYLQVIKECDFVNYNIYIPEAQGEVDVVAINTHDKTVYVCEVAIHLVTGLQYVKANRPDNVNRLVKKFKRGVVYANKYFPDYTKHFMLWSPIVKIPKRGNHSQHLDVMKIAKALHRWNRGVKLEVVINKQFKACLDELKDYAASQTKELKSPVLRLLQIEVKLARHLKDLASRKHRQNQPDP